MLATRQTLSLSKILVAARVPFFTKFIFLLLISFNWRAIPLFWHIRTLRPVFGLLIRWARCKLQTLFMSRKLAAPILDNFWFSQTNVGHSPFDPNIRQKGFVGFDDADWNLHLSNSSYGKVLDSLRLRAGVEGMPLFLRAGGTIPIGGTYYHFVREIPIFSNYEIRAQLGSWDNDKWAYLVCHFVTPKTSGASKLFPRADPRTITYSSLRHQKSSTGSLHSDRTSPASPPETVIGENEFEDGGEDDKLVMKQLLSLTMHNSVGEDDDVNIHAITVTRFCFKMGRITVPPPIVFALNGYCSPEESALANPQPPPHWNEVLKLAHTSFGGSMSGLRDFLKGGWASIPSDQRWWETAFHGNVELRRRRNLVALEAAKTGIDVFG